ncbi:MAG: hypothetical protein CMJ52_04565 [Planctomycetaceae bacterium]|nr:hypothetical protein [Planctomycetaceae bacterium]
MDDAPPQTPEDDVVSGPAWVCTMCLEPRRDPAFRSPVREEALVCRRCIRLAGRALARDPDHDWTRPSSDAVSDRGPDD